VRRPQVRNGRTGFRAAPDAATRPFQEAEFLVIAERGLTALRTTRSHQGAPMNAMREGFGAAAADGTTIPSAATVASSAFPTGSETCTSSSGFWNYGGQRGAGVRGRALGMLEGWTSLCSSGASCTPRVVGKRGQPLQVGELTLGYIPPCVKEYPARLSLSHFFFTARLFRIYGASGSGAGGAAGRSSGGLSPSSSLG
jgi:hypothetical protein